MTPNDEARAELEATVGDAIAEGYTVEAQVGDRYVISRPVRNPWRPFVGIFAIAVGLLLVLASPILGILLIVATIVVWVLDSRRRTRFQLYVNEAGEVVQEQART